MVFANDQPIIIT